MVGVFRLHLVLHFLAVAFARPLQGKFLATRVNESSTKVNASIGEFETQEVHSLLQKLEVVVRAANVTESEVHQCSGDLARARQRLSDARASIYAAQRQVNDTERQLRNARGTHEQLKARVAAWRSR